MSWMKRSPCSQKTPKFRAQPGNRTLHHSTLSMLPCSLTRSLTKLLLSSYWTCMIHQVQSWPPGTWTDNAKCKQWLGFAGHSGSLDQRHRTRQGWGRRKPPGGRYWWSLIFKNLVEVARQVHREESRLDFSHQLFHLLLLLLEAPYLPKNDEARGGVGLGDGGLGVVGAWGML